MEGGFPWGDMQEVAHRAKLGARGWCKVKEEEAIWTGLGTPQRVHWGVGSLGEGQQLGLNRSVGPKQDSYPNEETSSFVVINVDCWFLGIFRCLSLFSPIGENISYTKSQWKRITKAVFGLLYSVSWTVLLYWEKAICMEADTLTASCLLWVEVIRKW